MRCDVGGALEAEKESADEIDKILLTLPIQHQFNEIPSQSQCWSGQAVAAAC